ncbi:MAG: hypothetical protein Q9221_009081 [Calogaya cf. arnoldii]
MACQHTFFTLPREVRDEIYTLVLNSPAPPPVSPKEAGPRYREKVNDSWSDHPDPRSVFYPLPSKHVGTIAALSQCNRQLRKELQEFGTSSYLNKNLTYEIDAMLRGEKLWLTWTNFPYPVTKIDHLRVNLRLFDIYNGGGLFWGCGGPGTTFVVLYRALNRLLNHGPGFFYKHGEDHSLKIDTMTINVLHGYRQGSQPNPVVSHKRLIEDRKKIYRFICQELHHVVLQGLLSERVRTLKVCDGDIMQKCTTDGIEPRAEVTNEWIKWGFHWGVDEAMKIAKVESSDFCLSRKEAGEVEGKETCR